jgi:uncharacterized protein
MQIYRCGLTAKLFASFLTCVFLCASGIAHADEQRHPLWRVKGKSNQVFLLGSMHFLPSSEKLPDVMDKAYAEAERLVMEIDMDDMDPMTATMTTMQLGMLPEGKSLQELLGPQNAAQLDKSAQTMGIDAAMLSRFKPWLAAMTVSQLMLMKKGFNPQDGVEMRFVARAAQDNKEITGLETIEEQLHLFADLTDKDQAAYLMYTLEELDTSDAEIEQMITAWRRGDSSELDKSGTKDFEKFPKLYRSLTVDRNKRWIAPIEKMLQANDDYLVIVGALHLVGKEGVVELLKQRGFKVEQQ